VPNKVSDASVMLMDNKGECSQRTIGTERALRHGNTKPKPSYNRFVVSYMAFEACN
jgi:hypothetical protein